MHCELVNYARPGCVVGVENSRLIYSVFIHLSDNLKLWYRER
jgi:hypothetical protein